MQDIIALEGRASETVDQRLSGDTFAEEQSLIQRISAKVHWHVAPIIMLAHSRTNLPAKVRVFLHTLGLLCRSRSELKELCESIVSLHTDYGTEKAICRVRRCPLDVILPYLHAPSLQSKAAACQEDHEMFLDQEDAGHVCDADVFVDDCLPQASVDEASFDLTLEGPDMNHIIHNATNNLGDVCDCYSPCLKQLKAVCSLLSGRESKQQLIETCFNTLQSVTFQDQISSFAIVVHEKRWNTIASAIEEVASLESALKRFWSLSQFLGRQPGATESVDPVPIPRAAAADSEDCGVNLQVVDDAIGSDMFWGAIKVLKPIAIVQREAVRFVNGCPCHTPFEHEGGSKEFKLLCDLCPLRGRRCAELAAGDFFRLIQSVLEVSGTVLESELPRQLSEEEVSQLLQDFERARQHLIMTYVMKLTFWTQPPFVMAGLAHWNPSVRVDCVRKCLESSCVHPRISQLKHHMDSAEEFLEAGGLWREWPQLDPLRELACEMRLMFTSAWRVEGQHARTKKAATHAPHHSAPYTSLSHRLPEIKTHLEAFPQDLPKLAAFMDKVKSGQAAAKALGFSEDLLLKCGWISPKTFEKKKVGFNVVYHDDPHLP